jgi:hypothetical protein
MPKRSRKKPRLDFNVTAATVVALATGQGLPMLPKPSKKALKSIAVPKKNPHAVALGRRGGKVGGPARAKALTAKERSEIALKAARARWGMDDE